MRVRPNLTLSVALMLLASVALACSGRNTAPKATDTAPPATSAAISSPSTASSVTSGAGPDERASRSIKLAAASDLRRAMVAMQPAIEQHCDTRITFVFGSSGQLKEQILAGADFTLFLSADTGFVEELERAGRLVPNGRAAYGVGRITLIWRSGLPPLTAVSDLSRPDLRRISIANPGHAPYGRAAQQAMSAVGVWDGVQSRLVLGENIRQATDYVQQGNADAGVSALALVIDTDTPYQLIDAALHQPIIQGGGVVAGTKAELTGRCVLQYLLDPAGQEVLRRFGFEQVPAP